MNTTHHTQKSPNPPQELEEGGGKGGGVRSGLFAPLVQASVLLFLTSCATQKEESAPPPPPPPPPEAEIDLASRQSAYLRDIRPRVVTYDGQSSQEEESPSMLIEEDFSTGSFLPLPSH